MSMGIRASAARMPFCRLSHIMSNPTNGHETRIAPRFVLPQSSSYYTDTNQYTQEISFKKRRSEILWRIAFLGPLVYDKKYAVFKGVQFWNSVHFVIS